MSSEKPAKANRKADFWMTLAAVVIAALMIVAATQVEAQTFTILHTFTGAGDGDTPYAGLSADRAGNLYGTAYTGGNLARCRGFGCGTVYRLDHKNGGWIFSTLYQFNGPDGQNPQARVIVGPDGNLYGTTTYGGSAGDGTVFRLQPPPTICKSVSCPWTETVLYSFQGGSDGANPTYGDLAFDQLGNLYGTTPFGGSSNCTNSCGTVYELSPTNGGWVKTTIHAFQGNDGDAPYAGVIFDQAGNMYGTTIYGGGQGNAYKLTPSGSGWTITNVYNFPFDANTPYGALTFDSAGNLYGISGSGPLTIYELSPSNGSWTYTALYSFDSGYGSTAQLALDPAGNLYGTVLIDSIEVFELSTSGGQWTLTGFDDTDEQEPYGNVLLDANGNIYATSSECCVFEITR